MITLMSFDWRKNVIETLYSELCKIILTQYFGFKNERVNSHTYSLTSNTCRYFVTNSELQKIQLSYKCFGKKLDVRRCIFKSNSNITKLLWSKQVGDANNWRRNAMEPIKLYPYRYTWGCELWLNFHNTKLKQCGLIVNYSVILNI